jgi:signal transduction histidine kinase
LVQLRTQRTALVLYGVLLVLPTLVLGGLQWRQLHREYQAELEDVPRKAEDAARRFREDVGARLKRLLQEEEQRSFEEYAEMVCRPGDAYGLSLVPSPLASRQRPEAIVLWFAYDVLEGRYARVDMWAGAQVPEQAPELMARLENEFAPVTRRLVYETLEETALRRTWRIGEARQDDVRLSSLAVNRFYERQRDCLQYHQEFMWDTMVPLQTSPFTVQFFLEDGRPRLFATRRVVMTQRPELERMSGCLQQFDEGVHLVQGFFIDPDWLFRQIPGQVARSVLNEAQHFVTNEELQASGTSPAYHAYIHLLRDLDVETQTEEERDFGRMAIAVDTADLGARFRTQELRFFGLAGMLAFSLGTGLLLMLRSVRHDLEQAQRTENFVAAVTHELRTPVSTIKLHGEMLLDGWARDPERQREYYQRIVKETERLGTLVERVLEKSRLSGRTARAEPEDLNTAVESLRSQLLAHAPPQGVDLAFELATGLPQVLLNHEALESMLENLVENARKYAPVDPTQPDAEPIRVVTRQEDGRVLLEVQDRGPGIDPREATKIFEAFYRIGNEATRTSRGTGLGLHLVLLHAESIGATVEVLPRPGGGSVFRVAFEAA